MSDLINTVNQRTRMVGQNRLELLLFRLQGKQLYGINVFKVKEVLPCPKLTAMPKSNRIVRGVAHIRGVTVPILDMGLAIGQRAIADADLASCFVIMAEYNKKTQGFLVRGVDRIVNKNWEEILPPPKGAGKDSYLTAVTRQDDQLVEIVDVEKILAEITPLNTKVRDGVVDQSLSNKVRESALKVLVVDDSSVARRQILNCMEAIGVEAVTKNDGKQALEYLQSLVQDGSKISDHLALMISDVEMPEMDGYTLTANCKSDPQLRELFIMLHTSLSGVFNRAMVEKVGADDFLAKFSPDELAGRVSAILKERMPG